VKVELKRAIAAACMATIAGTTVLAMRSGGAEVTDERRDELLARAARNEHVELELDLLAFKQETGVQNRKFIRFRDESLMAMGRTGKGKPFLRDHAQDDVTARAGTILDSSTTKLGPGSYEIRQTVRLTAPWAVSLALRGLLDSVSIGWNPTGPIMCSACNAPIGASCYHYPGARLRMQDFGEQGKRLVRDPNGDVTVEWIFTSAELVETSAVSVPAVPGAEIETIRAALSALDPHERPHAAKDKEDMPPELLALLKLAATASDHEAINAVRSLIAARDTAIEQHQASAKQLTALTAQVALVEAATAKRSEDEFITSAIAEGKLIVGSKAEESLRAWHKFDPKAAAEHVKAAPRITPVGAPPARGEGDPKGPKGTENATQTDLELSKHGFNPGVIRGQLKQLGVKNIDKALDRVVVGEEV
jgi:hypothetical protein